MFNLGTKQLCLTVTRRYRSKVIHRRIRNFAIPTVAAAGRQGKFLLQKNAVAGVYTITRFTPYDDTKTYDIVLGIRSERVLSNIFSDIDVWTFNLKQVVLTLVGRLLQLKLQDLTIR
jgi:hypothetical protein